MSGIHEFGRQTGTPAAMASQTIGPFRTAARRLLARRALLRSSIVFARDPRNAAAAPELGRPVDATVTDLIFGITQPVPATPRYILLNVSGLLWQPNPHLGNTVYQQSVRSILDNLIGAGRRVTVFPMSSTRKIGTMTCRLPSSS